MWRLVVLGVIGGAVLVGGGWSSLSRMGSGDGVSLGGRGRGDSRWCVSLGAGDGRGWWQSPHSASVAWSPGGRGGGMVLGRHCWWWGGQGWVPCCMGVWASRRVVWVLCVLAVRFLWSLAGCAVDVRVWGGCLDVRVWVWSAGSGWLLVDACWHGVCVGGLLVVVGCSL